MKTAAEIQAEIDALQAEIKTIEMRSAEIDALRDKISAEQIELVSRRKELSGYNDWRWYHNGLIDNLSLELLESQKPIYKSGTDKWNKATRIISVDKKWIEIKEAGETDPTKYNRDTGWRMRARDSYGAIDAAKALAIWNEHLTKNK